MSKVSKTARASAVSSVGEKKVISDEVYIKNLRNDVASGIYVSQEGAKALLRAYDAALVTINELNVQVNGVVEQDEVLKETIAVLSAENEVLKAEIDKIKDALSGPSATEVEAKNNHD